MPITCSLENFGPVRVADLPFHDWSCCIVDLTRLPPPFYMSCEKNLTTTFYFIHPTLVTGYDIDHMLASGIEILLRFFAVNQSSELSDNIPPNCEVKICKRLVDLPPVNKKGPNGEIERFGWPIVITDKFLEKKCSTFTMDVQWLADHPFWAFQIAAYRRITPIDLQHRITANHVHRKSFKVAKEEIQKLISCPDDDDDEIQICLYRVSLVCPLGKTRIRVPIRGSNCRHLQCFDLLYFLMVNEKRPKWECPICRAHCSKNGIIIDDYFETILTTLSEEVMNVQISLDGSWRECQNRFCTNANDILSISELHPENTSDSVILLDSELVSFAENSSNCTVEILSSTDDEYDSAEYKNVR